MKAAKYLILLVSVICVCMYVAHSQSNTNDDSKPEELTSANSYLITGEVTDKETGKPMEDVNVSISNPFKAPQKTVSSKAGLFEIRVPIQEWLNIFIYKEGYVPYFDTIGDKDTDMHDFKIALLRGGKIFGRIIDKTGLPVEGVYVMASEMTSINNKNFISNKEGYYSLDDIDLEKIKSVTAYSDSEHWYSKKDFEIKSGEKELKLDFVVDRPIYRNISGRVTDNAGNPIADANIVYGIAQFKKETNTDSNGTYSLKIAGTAQNILSIKAKSFATRLYKIDKGVNQKVDAVLEKGHSTRIKMVDEFGNPIQKVLIGISLKNSTRTDNNQGYEFYQIDTINSGNGIANVDNLPDQGVYISVYSQDYINANNIEIKTNQEENVIEMQPCISVRGKVVDAITGKPITNFKVIWGMRSSDRSDYSSKDGYFDIKIRDLSEYTHSSMNLKLLAEGYFGESKVFTKVTDKTFWKDLLFELTPSKPIKIHVVDSDGKPISNAKVKILDYEQFHYFNSYDYTAQAAYCLNLTTSKDGVFSLENPPERKMTIFIQRDGFADKNIQCEDIAKLNKVVLIRPASVKVISKADKNEEQTVSIVENNYGYTSEIKTDNIQGDINKTYSGLEPGEYQIKISKNGRANSRNVTLKSMQTAVVDFKESLPVVLTGKVTIGGKSISHARISTDYGKQNYTGLTDERGNYRLELPKPINCVLFCDTKSGIVTRAYIKTKIGKNVQNFVIPGGTISGKVINKFKKSSEANGYIVACRFTHVGYRNYESPRNDLKWVSFCDVTVKQDGSFNLTGVSKGPIMLKLYDDTGCAAFKTVNLKENMHVNNVTLEVKQKGTLDISLIDASTKLPIPNQYTSLRSKEGVILGCSNNTTPSKIIPGKYKLWVEPNNSLYLPVSTDVEVKSNKITRIKIALSKVKQRIVFNLSNDLKNKCSFNSGDTANCATCSPDLSDPWIGYSIRDAKTGKYVINNELGSMWGGLITDLNSKTTPAIAVLPGKYKLNAIMKNISDSTANLKGSLWHYEGIVDVKPGKDSIIYVK